MQTWKIVLVIVIGFAALPIVGRIGARDADLRSQTDCFQQADTATRTFIARVKSGDHAAAERLMDETAKQQRTRGVGINGFFTAALQLPDPPDFQARRLDLGFVYEGVTERGDTAHAIFIHWVRSIGNGRPQREPYRLILYRTHRCWRMHELLPG